MSAGPGKAEENGMAEPAKTPYERFVEATKRLLSVSKTELEKREKAWRKKRARAQEREKRV